MKSLPVYTTQLVDLSLMQTNWKSILDPILINPYLNGFILQDVSLMSGSNVINHRLGRKQQGWVITDRNGTATVYRSAPFNALTLTLTASAPVTADIYVF